MENNIFDQFAKKKEHEVVPVVAAHKPMEPAAKRTLAPKKPVVNQPAYIYKDAKPTHDWDLDRIRTFIKTEINDTPNGDPDQVWYSVERAETKKEGKFYALKCHLGQKKQKTIKKAYSVDELVTYFFGPICEDDFSGYSQYPKTLAKRQAIWNKFYDYGSWALHKRGPIKKERVNIFDTL